VALGAKELVVSYCMIKTEIWQKCIKYLVDKTNKCTKFQFYWYYDCTCFGQPFCPSSGVLNRTSALVHFIRLWWL